MSVIRIETIAFHRSGEEWKRPRAKKFNPRAFARAKLILALSTCCFSCKVTSRTVKNLLYLEVSGFCDEVSRSDELNMTNYRESTVT